LGHFDEQLQGTLPQPRGSIICDRYLSGLVTGLGILPTKGELICGHKSQSVVPKPLSRRYQNASRLRVITTADE
jgi:hypothetical protein